MKSEKTGGLDLVHMIIYAMFGALMFCSKFIMEGLPNIHPIAMFIVVLTVVYRSKALIPLYIYILLDGFRWSFSAAWMPYLYVWLPLWGVAMLLPRSMSRKSQIVVYPIVCMLHGLMFGIIYVPAQAIMYGMSFRQALAWVIAGLPFDISHGVGNLVMGLLVEPLAALLKKLESKL